MLIVFIVATHCSGQAYLKIMESMIKQGADFLKREERRVENLLKGKVSDEKTTDGSLCKLDDEYRHANAEGVDLIDSKSISVCFYQDECPWNSHCVAHFDTVSLDVSLCAALRPPWVILLPHSWINR